MRNTYNIHKGAFEPCHIADEVSPFSAYERKSAAHSERFSSQINNEVVEAVTDFSKNGGESANMQKNNNNMSNL